jgi:hypothetical protein
MFLCATAILAGAAALPAAAAPGGAAVKLNNALEFPVVSFGLQVYDDATAQSLTTMALGVGVRNFFSSVLAGNQQGFGAAIKATKVPRKELFICGSVNTGNGFFLTRAQSDSSKASEIDMTISESGIKRTSDFRSRSVNLKSPTRGRWLLRLR